MSVRGMRVLVTGGAGFIGSHLIDSLLAQGARVRVYDNFSSGSEENLAHVKADIELIRGDILDADALAKAMQGVTVVSHQAAQLEIVRCLEDPAMDLQVNAMGTVNVLKAAAVAQVHRVIVASSACVYGQAQRIPQSEDHPTQPNWPYGVSKRAAELYAGIFQSVHRLPIALLRYGIVYGPREWYGRVLTMFLHRVLEGKPLVVFGDGKQVRDFICVHDVVKAHDACLESGAAVGRTYNVATGIGTTVAELAECVVRQSGGAGSVVHEDPAEGTSSSLMPERVRLPAELKTMVLDIQRACAELGWRPTVKLADGVREELEWAKAHRHRWQMLHI